MAMADLSMRTSHSKVLAPSPPRRFLLGHWLELKNDPIGLLLRSRSAFGDIVRLKVWWITAHLLAHPDHIQHVLQKNQEGYDKDLEPLRRLHPVLGQGMVTADGAAWQHQRDVARPAFQPKEVQSFGPVITASAADLAARWTRIAEDGQVIDMHREMMQITLRIAGRALFGVDLEDEVADDSDLLNATMAAGLKRLRAIIAAPIWLPTANNRKLRRSRRALEQMIDRIIEKHVAGGHQRPDLLARLLDDHGAIDPEKRTAQFYDEAITLILAGHETTANGLAFTLHLLGRHPEIMANLREEARAVLGSRPAEFGDLPKLAYTRMVLDEAMRLYPPVWIVDRNAREDDVIGGYHIPKGGLLMLSPYVMHRHPDFWPDAERFDPRRFEKSAAAVRPRHAYFPFSLGPRVCIGANFALAETVMVLATLAARFDVEPLPGHVLKLDPNVTLRPKNGLPMTVRAA
ncbi:MAG: cytochrome P450 [Geminicoccaceae bacterium]